VIERDRALPRLFFFDCDGVLLESAVIKTQAFADLFADHDPDVVSAIVALHVRHGGLSRYAKFEMIYRDILRRDLADDESAALGSRLSELIDDAMRSCRQVDGLEEALALSAEATRVVISGTPQDDLTRTLTERGLLGRFDAVIGSPTEKPAAILAWLERCRLEAQDAVLIGDAWSDWDAAQQTGIRFVGRVSPGDDNPFPPDVDIITDLHGLEAALTGESDRDDERERVSR
jgi:phosphoglycolate phosphatase-like HAD superfamily hydrolase